MKPDAIKALADTWDDYSRLWEKSETYKDLPYLGAEWIAPASCEWIMQRYVGPYVTRESVVIELGCGGGKFTQYLAPLCRKVMAIDISSEMLARAKDYLDSQKMSNVEYIVGDGKSFAGVQPPIDLIFSYDVLLHLPVELVYSYLLDGQRVLKQGGIFFLHQVNIQIQSIMNRLIYQVEQEWWQYPLGHPKTIGRMFFVTPEVSKALAVQAGYEVIKEESQLERDILLALRKGAGAK